MGARGGASGSAGGGGASSVATPARLRVLAIADWAVLLEDGSVQQFISGDYGSSQLALPPAVALTGAAFGTTCAASADRTWRCVGNNDGARFLPKSKGIPEKLETPTEVPRAKGALSLAIGNDSMCAIQPDKTVLCWGSRDLGDGKWAISDPPGDAPVAPTGLGTVRSIAVGNHSCAVTTAGEVKCWGSDGWVGTDGEEKKVLVPTTIAMPKATKVSISSWVTCVLLGSGAVKCWGPDTGGTGVLGDGKNADSKVPVDVVGLDDAVDISVGAGHACALRKDGSVKCWGWGQATPADIASEKTFLSVVAGTGNTRLFLSSDGELLISGSDRLSASHYATPTLVSLDDEPEGAAPCATTYAGPTGDPQVTTYCQAAWSHACAGREAERKQTCDTLAALGAGIVCSYCD